MKILKRRRKRNRFLIWLPLLAALFIFSNIGEVQAFDKNIRWPWPPAGIYKATGGNEVVTVEWYQASNSATSAPNWYYLGYNIYCSPTSDISPFDFGGNYIAEIIPPTQGSAGKKWSHTIDHLYDSSGNSIDIINNRTYNLGVRAFVTSGNPDPNIRQEPADTFDTILPDYENFVSQREDSTWVPETEWNDDQTPNCRINVQDTCSAPWDEIPYASGLDVSEAKYQYSTNGGSSWSGWQTASCTGSDGTKTVETITASNVPFNQDSETQNKIKFSIQDMYKNTGISLVYTVKIDTIPPFPPIITVPGYPGQTVFTTDSTPTIIGIAEINSTVMIRDTFEEVETILGTATAEQINGLAQFKFTPIEPLAIGSHQITARAIDPAGNSSDWATPKVTVVVQLAIQNVQVVPSPPNNWFNASLRESATLSYVLSADAPGVTVVVTGPGVNQTIVNEPQAGGIHSVIWYGRNPNTPAGTPVDDGDYTFNITADGVTDNTATVTVDSTKPTITNISDTPDPFHPFPEGIDANTEIQYTLRAPVGINSLQVSVEIFDAGGTLINTVRAYGDGLQDCSVAGVTHVENWIGTDNVIGGNAPDGLYVYRINARTEPPAPISAQEKTGTITLIRNNITTLDITDPDTGELLIGAQYDPDDGFSLNIAQLTDPDQLAQVSKAIVTRDPSLYLVSNIYDITRSEAGTFNPPAIITFPYDATIVGDVSNTLQVRRFDTTINDWVLTDVEQWVDTISNQIIFEITAFPASLYAIFTGADTTPPVVTITSPEAKEYYHTTDGEPTIIDIIYTAQDPVVNGFSFGVVEEIVLLNGEEYEYETIDLSILAGENTLTVKAIDKAGNIGWSKVKFTVVLVAQVTIKPEALKVTPGVLTAFVEFPEGHDVADIVDVTCDGALPESMMLNEDGTVMIIKFRRDAIEEALSLLDPPQSIDTAFKVRGTLQDAYGTYIFEGTDTIMKILEGSVPPEKGKGKPPEKGKGKPPEKGKGKPPEKGKGKPR